MMTKADANSSNTRQAMWLGIGQGASLIVVFLSAAILSRYFDKDEYGTYKQVLYIYSFLQTIFAAGLPGAYAYFLPRMNLNQGRDFSNNMNKALILLGLLASLFLFFTADIIAVILKNPELAVGLKIFSPYPLFILPTLGVEGINTALRRTKYLTFYHITTKLLMLLCMVLPVILFQGSYRTALVGWGIASFLSAIYAIVLIRAPFKGEKRLPSPFKFKEVFAYSSPLMLASFAGIAYISADQFFISRYFGAATFAVFANGFISIPFIGIILGSAKSVLMPVFSKAANEGSIDMAMISYKNAVLSCAIIIIPIIAFSFFYATDIMTLLYGDQYIGSTQYFRVALFKDLFNLFPFLAVLLALGDSKTYFKVHLFFAIAIWAIDFFIVSFFTDPLLLAMASVFIFIIGLIYFNIRILFKYKIKLLDTSLIKGISKILLHTIIFAFITYSLSEYFMKDVSVFYRLLVATPIFYMLLIPTGLLIKTNYIEALSILKKGQ